MYLRTFHYRQNNDYIYTVHCGLRHLIFKDRTQYYILQYRMKGTERPI